MTSEKTEKAAAVRDSQVRLVADLRAVHASLAGADFDEAALFVREAIGHVLAADGECPGLSPESLVRCLLPDAHPAHVRGHSGQDGGTSVGWATTAIDKARWGNARRTSSDMQPPERGATIVHACPPGNTGLTTCCQRSPFELNRWSSLTVDPLLVTCGPNSAHPEAAR